MDEPLGEGLRGFRVSGVTGMTSLSLSLSPFLSRANAPRQQYAQPFAGGQGRLALALVRQLYFVSTVCGLCLSVQWSPKSTVQTCPSVFSTAGPFKI